MINWNESSTKRGAVWLVTAIIGIPMVLMGKDPSPLLLLASGVAGGLGVVMSDKP